MAKAGGKSGVKKSASDSAKDRANDDPIYARMRAICLALPDTTIEIKWGHPHYCVVGKIFTGCGPHRGVLTVGFKMQKEDAAEIVKDKRFWPAPYVGKHGWVATDARRVSDWEPIRALITDSYRLIAPKASVAKLDAVRKSPAR